MIGEMGRLVFEGFLAPRASARRWLEGGHGPDVAVLLLLLSYLIGSMFEVVLGGGGEGSRFGRHIAGIVSSGIAVAALSFLAFRLGKVSGGKATLGEMFLVLSWHALVTSFLWPLVFGLRDRMQRAAEVAAEAERTGSLSEMPEIGAGPILLGILALALSVWLLANYIAEAHQFRNTWGVLGVLVGLPMLIAFVVVSVAGGVSA